MELLPIGQRVTHFSGGEGTHGKGTIVGYNGVEPKNYGQSNPGKAAEMIGQVDDPQAKAALASGLVNSMYDKARYPYIVQWDPRTDDSEIARKYSNGYRDVYGDECRPIKE
jgi:hypothetical protein